MRYHVLYNDEKIIPNVSQNIRHWPMEYNLDNVSIVMTWELNDYPLTKKFIELWHTTHANAKEQDGGRLFQSSQMVLTAATEESILESRVYHNKLLRDIQKINKTSSDLSVNVPDYLFVNELDPYDKCEDKFNKAHYFFEKESKKWEKKYWLMEQRGRKEHFLEVAEILSNLNSTCHYNEQEVFVPDETEFHYVTILGLTYMSDSKKPNFLRYTNFIKDLESSDYEHFEYLTAPVGSLYLDFATLGKSLTEIAFTNDIDLIKTKQVAQQKTFNPWVRYTFNPPQEESITNYYNWIEKNKVADYYDLSLPEFTPGLHVLGNIISHNFKDAHEFSNFIQNKKVVGTVITDDNNISIL